MHGSEMNTAGYTIHLKSWETRDDYETFCQSDPGNMEMGLLPASDNAREANCIRCLELAKADAEETAAQCCERLLSLQGGPHGDV